MRRHLINTHKFKKVGTIIDKLQCIQTEQKNAKIRVKAAPSAPEHDNNELKELERKGANPCLYAETLPKNKKNLCMDLRRTWTEPNQEVHNKTCDNPTQT